MTGTGKVLSTAKGDEPMRSGFFWQAVQAIYLSLVAASSVVQQMQWRRRVDVFGAPVSPVCPHAMKTYVSREVVAGSEPKTGCSFTFLYFCFVLLYEKSSHSQAKALLQEAVSVAMAGQAT